MRSHSNSRMSSPQTSRTRRAAVNGLGCRGLPTYPTRRRGREASETVLEVAAVNAVEEPPARSPRSPATSPTPKARPLRGLRSVSNSFERAVPQATPSRRVQTWTRSRSTGTPLSPMPRRRKDHDDVLTGIDELLDLRLVARPAAEVRREVAKQLIAPRAPSGMSTNGYAETGPTRYRARRTRQTASASPHPGSNA